MLVIPKSLIAETERETADGKAAKAERNMRMA